MAENQHSTPTPPASAVREDFDLALSDANTIAGIIEHLADHAVSGEEQLFGSHFVWLADQLKMRLESIETASMTMSAGRA